MERVEQVKQNFVDFMEQKKHLNVLPATWTSSGEALSALSKGSPSSSVVMSSDGNFPYNALGHAHNSNIQCESSTESGPLLKEHDYIGLNAEVSSASSSVSGDDGADVEDTDLRLGRGPLKEDVCSLQHPSQQKNQPLLELELLEPKEKMQSIPLAFRDGFAASAPGLPSKNGFKRAYGEALGEKLPGANMASTIITPLFKQSQGPDFHVQQNVYLSKWPAPNSNVLYTSADAQLQSYESASAEPPPAKDQVVGWPPIRAYRRNSLMVPHPQPNLDVDGYSAVYVKVNMDGIPIGRKVDLNVYLSYESLLAALEEMFYSPSSGNSAHFLSNGEFALTYEDKEGDWMLVGDVPWGMFVNTVKRLRIVRGSEANGLGMLYILRRIGQLYLPIASICTQNIISQLDILGRGYIVNAHYSAYLTQRSSVF